MGYKSIQTFTGRKRDLEPLDYLTLLCRGCPDKSAKFSPGGGSANARLVRTPSLHVQTTQEVLLISL